jgi:hypothetical protein
MKFRLFGGYIFLLIFSFSVSLFSLTNEAFAQKDLRRCVPEMNADAIFQCFAADEANVRFTDSCAQLRYVHGNILHRARYSVGGDSDVSCAILSEAVEKFSGKPSVWRDCVVMSRAVEVTFAREASACLTTYLTDLGKSKTQLADCSAVLKLLGEALEASGRPKNLPKLSMNCDVARQVVADVSGQAPAGFGVCLDYSRENLVTHFAACVGTSVTANMDCGAARSLYETKLRSANGGSLPQAYQTLTCNEIQPALDSAIAKLTPKQADSEPMTTAAAFARLAERVEAPVSRDRNDSGWWLSGGITGALVFWILGGALVYLLPTIVAFSRRHPSRILITLINVFLGWSGLGWLVAMVWSFVSPGKDSKDV